MNAEIYQTIAENIDFKIIQKISQNQHQLESLLFGMGNLLEKGTETNQKWKQEFEFLKSKFKSSKFLYNLFQFIKNCFIRFITIFNI